MKTETAYAIDIASGTAREFAKAKAEEYRDRCSETEFFGIADVIGTLHDGTPVVIDWKTGQRNGDPHTKYQLRFFATALHLITGAPSVEARFGYIDEVGACFYETARFSVIEDDFAKTLMALGRLHDATVRARALLDEGKVPDVRTGDHCQWCPAWGACPAKAGIVARTLPDLEWAAEQLDLMSPEQVGTAWVKYKELEQAMYRVGDILKERAKQEPIPLPNGQWVKPVPSTRTSVDAKKLVSLAKRLGASKRDIDECVSMTTYDTLRQVGRKNE